MHEALFEIYTWILCPSYLHEKQTSRIQSLLAGLSQRLMPGLCSRTILRAHHAVLLTNQKAVRKRKCRPNYSEWLPRYSSRSHFVFRCLFLSICVTFMVKYVITMPIGYCNNYKTHKNVVLKQTRSDIQCE